MRYQTRENTEQQVDMSPLIDMVFILLIFFMVSATFVKDMDLEISRPKASSSTPSSSKAIRLFIDNKGETYLDGKSVRAWAIQSKLREILKIGNSSTVLIITDGSVPANKLIEVVDQCRMAGAKDVGVVTESES